MVSPQGQKKVAKKCIKEIHLNTKHITKLITEP